MREVAEIKSRLPIDQVVARYVQLKRVGRNFKGLCPFHQERTPSFIVSPDKDLAYCFGCRKGGDQFMIVQELEGLSFPEALKMLAEQAGVALKEFSTPKAKEKQGLREKIYDVCAKSARFFSEKLAGDEGKKAREYCEKRGITEETINCLTLGFAPELGNQLLKYLLTQGFSNEEILAAGVCMKGGVSGTEMYDRFRGRLIFPIKDAKGKICAFGARALKPEDEPKYLNSPETPIFQKSEILYGFGEHREDIRKAKEAILCEGYLDVIALQQAGYLTAVASCGTACTEEQLRLLKRTVDRIVLALDRDEAGTLATLRAILSGLQIDVPMYVALFEKGKDPDESIQSDPKSFQQSIQEAVSASAYVLGILRKKYPMERAEGRRLFLKEFLPYLDQIQSTLEVDAWIRDAAKNLSLDPPILYDELKRFQRQKRVPQPLGSPMNKPEKAGMSDEEYCIGLILNYREARDEISGLLRPDDFSKKELQDIYSKTASESMDDLFDNEKQICEMLMVFTESLNAHLSWDEIKCEIKDVVRRILARRFEREKRQLIDQMKGAHEKNDLLSKLNTLIEEQSRLLITDHGKKN